MSILSSSVHLMVLPPFLGTSPPRSHAIEPTLSESVLSLKKNCEWWYYSINNVDNLFTNELQTIPLILNLYIWWKKHITQKLSVRLVVCPSDSIHHHLHYCHWPPVWRGPRPSTPVWSSLRLICRASTFSSTCWLTWSAKHDDSVGGDLKKTFHLLFFLYHPLHFLFASFSAISILYNYNYTIMFPQSHSSSSHLRAEILEIFSSKAVVTPSCPLLSLCSSDHHLLLSDLLTNLIIWSTFFWIELISLLCVSLVLFTMFLKLSRSLFRRSFFTCIARLMSFSSQEMVLRIDKQEFFCI